jgi:outer membrane protein assembly factor BamD (BamD/ComL family)
MKRNALNISVLIVLFGMLFCSQLFAQNIRPQRQNNPQQQQRLNNERLANEFYRNQEWDKAAELYQQLFRETNAQHHFTFYLNCLLQLDELDEAEKIIKQFSGTGSYREQADIDLAYIYQLKGNNKRASRMFDKVLSNLPPDRNRISMIANAFLNRGMPDYALQVYESAAKMPQLDYPFYLESATAYQFAGQHDMMVDRLLDHANYDISHLNLIKSRLQNLMMMDVDNSISDMLREKMLLRAQASPSNELYAEMLIWFALQQKEYDLAMIQAIAIDRRFGDKDQRVLELAEISLANQQYEVALNGYNHIVRKGTNGYFYPMGLRGLLTSRFQIAEQNPATEKATYQALANDINAAFEQLGLNRQTYELSTILANIYAFHLNRQADATQVIERSMQLPLREDETAVLKMQLADILLLKNEVWEATLLYSQIEKAHRNDPIGHEARFRNAKLRYYIGEFGWAQTHLDVLKAATSKLIANDALALSLLIRDNLTEDTTGASLRLFAQADLHLYQRNAGKALDLLDSLEKTVAAGGMLPYILSRKAEIAARQGQYHAADSLYGELAKRFSDSYLADQAIYRSALLNEAQLNNPSKARQLFGQLLDKYPASLYTSEARRKYRLLQNIEA